MSVERDILAFQQGKIDARTILDRIRSSHADGHSFALSEEQRGLYAQQALHPDDVAYNVPWCFRIRETLDLHAFEKACRTLLRVHPILRAQVRNHDGEPRYWLGPQPERPVDFRRWNAADDTGLLGELETLATRPFALDREAPFRAYLMTRGPEDHLLLLVIHHLVIDGHSLPQLMATLWNAYDAAAKGLEVPPQPLDDGVQAFADWQRNWLDSKAADTQRRYWHQILGTPWPPLLPLRPSAPGGEPASRVARQPLSDDLSRAVRDLARHARVTPAALCLAAYRHALGLWSGNNDIAIGTAMMNRPDARFARSVGFFVNMVVLRASTATSQDVEETLRLEQRVLSSAMQHGQYPFAKLARELASTRHDAAAPMVQAAFGFAGRALMDWGAAAYEGVARHRIEPFPGLHQEADCDLLLEVQETASGFDVTVKQGREGKVAGAAEMLAAFLDSLACMAAAAAVQPGAVAFPNPLHHAPPAAPAVPDVADPQCLHEQVQAAARRDPAAVAVRWAGGQMSYGELDARAGRLAASLLARGTARGSRVGLYGRHEPELLVGMLGTLKAGAAYLPLDPAYPVERLVAMVKDAEPDVIVVAGGAPGEARAAFQDTPLLHIASDVEEAPPADGRAAKPGDLAYLIYTSGSTGTPKGVMVEHRQIAHTLQALAPIYRLTPADRVLQCASPAFDVSGLEIFSALTSGASLVLRDDGWFESPRKFRELCEEAQVTVLHLPASLWYQYLVADGEPAPASLRVVVIGGEPAHAAWLQQWRDRNPGGPRLFNQYGPTEAAVVATMAELTDPDAPLDIGTPLAGVSAWVLDDAGGVVAEGEAGELALGGPGVARGYWNRPDLTAARFVPDPFDDRTDARLYRTGDVARRTPSGSLELRGRIDRQVKLRGVRIELEEVEAQLARHPAIRDAAVLVLGDEPASRRLVAFVQVQGDRRPAAGEIRAFVQSVLPDAMVPADYVFVSAMPLGPNGKRDLHALAPGWNSASTPDYVAPQTPYEEGLAQLLAEVLQVSRVGRTDMFFDMGGNSLIALRVQSRLQKLFGVAIPLRALSDGPMVPGLADYLQASGGQAGAA